MYVRARQKAESKIKEEKMKNQYFLINPISKYHPTLKKALEAILDKAKLDGDLMHTRDITGRRFEYNSIKHVINYASNVMFIHPNIKLKFENCVSTCVYSSIITTQDAKTEGKSIINNLLAILLSAYSPIDPCKFLESEELTNILKSNLGFNDITLITFRRITKEVRDMYIENHDTDNIDIKKLCEEA